MSDNKENGLNVSKEQMMEENEENTKKIETEPIEKTGTAWRYMNNKEKLRSILIIIAKIIGIFGALYFFVCSLDIMSLSFRLVGGRYVTEFFQNPIITNPLAGLMIGVVVTVVVQSSSTSTSIIVTMVGARLLKVKQAIPIIMGANIGTSVTSTLVSLGHMGNGLEFQRAFAGAIIHDIFNFLSVAILLPLELATGYLEVLSDAIVYPLIKNNVTAKEVDILNAITKPLTNKIIQLDRKTLDLIAQNLSLGNESLRKFTCDQILKNKTIIKVKCEYAFRDTNWPEWGIGLLLLICSLIVLSACLIILVKILSSILKGKMRKILEKTLNSQFPGVFKYLTPYVAMVLGTALTIAVQSSSVFTSALVPLVSLGVFSLENVFPLILGSNIGTTITGILAAFSSSSKTLNYSLQIALCHTFFNITGILIWFPIPPVRRIPIRIASYLSKVTQKYRWFAIFYIIFVFVLVPLLIFGLSLGGIPALAGVLSPIAALLITILVINIIQKEIPTLLPSKLRNWNFLPRPLRSLEPYDRFLRRYLCCCKKCQALGSKIDKVHPTYSNGNQPHFISHNANGYNNNSSEKLKMETSEV